jgi:hemoglobin/transferrin/lactoferrin receptor protein
VPPAGETFPTRAFPVTDFTLAGAFLADEMTLGPVTFYPALRFDYYNLSPENDPLLPTFTSAKQHGSRVSPKLGVVVKATDSIRLFANYAQGFKSPAPSQVNNFFENPAQGYKSIPNPNLRPETSKSFEGGVRFNNELVSIDLTGFHAKFDGFIDQVETTGQAFPTPATPWIYQWVNLSSAKVSGAEARISVRPARGVTANLAVSYADGEGDNGSGVKTPLQSVDPLKTVLGVGYDDPDRMFGGKAILTYGGQKEIANTLGMSCYLTKAATPNCFTGEDYAVLDLTAYVRPFENLTIRAGLFNVFDQKYWMWSDFRGLAKNSAVKDAYTQPGRNGSVSISYRF